MIVRTGNVDIVLYFPSNLTDLIGGAAHTDSARTFVRGAVVTNLATMVVGDTFVIDGLMNYLTFIVGASVLGLRVLVEPDAN